MDARFYNSEEIDIQRLANDLENIYRAQGYQSQQIGNADQVMVQLKKGGEFEALIGMQAALSVIIQRSANGTLAMIGQQKWIDKAAIGTIGIVAAPVLWPLIVTAGVGAIRQASLGNQVLNVVDGLVRQQRPEIQGGPVPAQIMPQLQQQWAPPPYSPPPPQYIPPGQSIVVSIPATQPAYQPTLPAPAPARSKQLRCPACNTPYDVGDTFCTGCGKSLKTLCANCKTELKDNTSFCPNCGASTFVASNSAAPSVPSASSAPPVQSTPTYTPPPVQPKPKPVEPDVPYYTPPANPPTPPTTPAYNPYTAPTVTNPPTPKPAPPEPYVPPTPKEPPVMPKPTVTFIPAAGTPAPSKPQPPKPSQPDVPYYTPPVNPQPPQSPQTPLKQQKAQTPPPPQAIKSKPAAQSYNPNVVWGMLSFADGKQVQLSGERDVVGRYDHDLGGLQPEIDLGKVQGADTVSRVHAVLEHIGSTYTLTDLNSTNATRLNGKRLEPDKATPINDGDALQFGKVTCTFKKV